ncbi:MAG TPA: hypothetical protein DCS48_10635 [Desulfovibrio sp.]|nr:hypothetical protein [Desulfovibrio sp.]
MTYSSKTITVAAMLFVSSLMIVGTMHLPVFDGQNGFETMEDSFNSLRKGVIPPFKKIKAENNGNLGKNVNLTFAFRTNDEARIATLMLLRNKLTVTPKGRKVNIQGDLGYTLKFFMDDINLLYMNRFEALERRYSMPAVQSMYYLDRILQKFAAAIGAQKMPAQKVLVNKIRMKLLIPAYNLRKALPVSETSGFAHLALGTIGILFFAILWDISNFLFFGSLASEDFMKSIRIKLGRELSDEQKKAIIAKRKRIDKAKALKKKKLEKLKKTRGTKTNKDTLKKETKPKTKPGKSKVSPKKKKMDSAQPEKRLKKKPTANEAKPQKQKTQKKKAEGQKTTPKEKTVDPTKKKTAQAVPKKKRPVEKNSEGKPVRQAAGNKKVTASTSQTAGKKVNTQQGRKKL